MPVIQHPIPTDVEYVFTSAPVFDGATKNTLDITGEGFDTKANTSAKVFLSFNPAASVPVVTPQPLVPTTLTATHIVVEFAAGPIAEADGEELLVAGGITLTVTVTNNPNGNPLSGSSPANPLP